MTSKSKSSFLDISADDLNGFIDKNLQPDEGFLRDCCKNMDFLADYLKTHSGCSVAETIKVCHLYRIESNIIIQYFNNCSFTDTQKPFIEMY